MSGHGPDVSRPFYTRVSRGLAGAYGVEQVLGAGCMSAVFRATDLRGARPVAIRVLRPELAAGIARDRFLSELRLEAALDHMNIVPVLDLGEADGLPFLVMPFIEGESLEMRLERDPKLPLEEAVRITRDVAAALAAAHQGGTLHRDLKPSSILLWDDRVGVTDFGLARALDEAGAQCFTTAGLAVGTPTYMSPERGVASAVLDPRADQYSLACVLHEMLAGEPPFAARSPRALIYTHATRDPPRIRAFRPEVPRVAERVILRALSKAPGQRFPSVSEFSESLQTAVDGQGRTDPVTPLSWEGDGALPNAWDRIVSRVTRTVAEHPERFTAAVLGFGIVLVTLSILVTLWFLTPQSLQ